MTKEDSKRRKTELHNSQKTMNKMAISTYLSIITLNVNGRNSPVKRQSGCMVKKQDLSICCLQETHFSFKDTHTASEQMEKGSPCKRKPKESWGSYTCIRQKRL